MQFSISFKLYFKKYRYTVTHSLIDDKREHFILYLSDKKVVIESNGPLLRHNLGTPSIEPHIKIVAGELKDKRVKDKYSYP